MALVVGTDTYISAVDADAYINANLISTDAKLVQWFTLAESDKEVLLRKACQVIERLPLTGVKTSSAQILQFPRGVYSEHAELYEYGHEIVDGVYIQTSVPQEVKSAQVEIALQLAVGVSSRVEAQRQGVKSFSLGSLSESYGSYSKYAMTLSAEAYDLLTPYIRGGFDII